VGEKLGPRVGGVELEDLRRGQYSHLPWSACPPRVDGRAIADSPFNRHRIPPVHLDTSTPSPTRLIDEIYPPLDFALLNQPLHTEEHLPPVRPERICHHPDLHRAKRCHVEHDRLGSDEGEEDIRMRSHKGIEEQHRLVFIEEGQGVAVSRVDERTDEVEDPAVGVVEGGAEGGAVYEHAADAVSGRGGKGAQGGDEGDVRGGDSLGREALV
jgi:hypothetical protein